MEEKTKIILLFMGFIIVVIIVVIIGILVIPSNNDNKPPSQGGEKYLMIQSDRICSDEDQSCMEKTSPSNVLQFDKNANIETLNISVPCGIPDAQKSITTFYYSRKIMFVLIGNECEYMGLGCKKGDVVRILYDCNPYQRKNCEPKIVEDLRTYNSEYGEDLNQTIVFDNRKNLLYKIDFPTKGNKRLRIQTYDVSSDLSTNVANQEIPLTPTGDDKISSSLSSDNIRFLFTFWTNTSSCITNFNRSSGIGFSEVKKFDDEIYTASYPVTTNDIFNHDFYVLKSDANDNCNKKCYSVRLYNPMTNELVENSIFERYLSLEDYSTSGNDKQYPIYQMYGIGNMLYLPHSNHIYEVDISLQYTVYIPGKNILNDNSEFDDSGSLSIFNSRLYSISFDDLRYWKINKRYPDKSEWIPVYSDVFGGYSRMTLMNSDMEQGVIIPKPSTDSSFECPKNSRSQRGTRTKKV